MNMDMLASREDEQALISHVLSLAVEDKTILEEVRPSDFYDPNHAEVWRVARELHTKGQRVSPNTVLRAADRTEGSVMFTRINSAVEKPVRAHQVFTAKATVQDLARKRELVVALDTARQRVFVSDDYDEASIFAQERLGELSGVRVPDSVVPFADAYAGWQERMNQGEHAARVFATPWPWVNDKIGNGLHSGRSYVIGGRPGEGKSIGGANLVQFAAEQGHVGLIFSMEMGQHEVVSRALASGANAELGQINRRQIDEYNFGRITSYVGTHRDMPLFIVDQANISMEKISRICRSVKRKHGLDVVFVDYLQLLDPSDPKLTRERQVAAISRSLKILSRELDCAVVTACQLNRNSSNEGRPPRLADLRESGSIEQDADVVILLHHDKDRQGEVDLVIAKNRLGPAPITITQSWSGAKAAIRNLR